MSNSKRLQKILAALKAEPGIVEAKIQCSIDPDQELDSHWRIKLKWRSDFSLVAEVPPFPWAINGKPFAYLTFEFNEPGNRNEPDCVDLSILIEAGYDPKTLDGLDSKPFRGYEQLVDEILRIYDLSQRG
jgi:hypothetical protein